MRIYKSGDALVEEIAGVGVHRYPGSPGFDELSAFLANPPEALIPEPIPTAPTADDLAAHARTMRDNLLRDVIDRYNAVRWETMTEAEKQVVRDYRQALLDWPEGTGFPDISTLPIMGTIKL